MVITMSKKLPRFLQSNVRIYFIMLILFAISTFFLGEHGRILAGAQILAVIIAAIYLHFSTRNRTKKLLSYLESMSESMDLTVRDTPLPVLIYNTETGEVVWSNELFASISGTEEPFFERSVTDIVPGYTWDWLLDGKNESDEPVQINDKLYMVYGSIVLSERDYVAMTYWIDVTEHTEMCNEYIDSRLIFTLLVLDNYDELVNGLNETEKSSLRSRINEIITAWIADKDGYLCRYDRDRYFFLFEERFLETIINDNFSVLEQVSTCTGSGGIQATLSIGIGKDGGSPQENYRFASLGIEMALSRGGNQAVVRNSYGFEFYGGRPQRIERKTKVKARVMASAFGELLNDASKVFVMGHKIADLDSIGAAIGVCCIARAKSKQVHVVVDLETSVANNLIDMMRQLPEYKNVFISAQEAILQADSKTLLVVTDTSRPEKVESESLLLSCTRIAVIDHHRRASNYIENAVLNFHEPYASSAAELVTDMMQYLVERNDILREEAEALLAGIVLDTKSFTINTGSGTFDAAAFLKRAGADAAEVKRMLQTDIDIAVAKYELLREAKIYRDAIAIAVSESGHCRISIAQAADELLGIKGVDTSFVIAEDNGTVFVSGRSIGNVNVQVILEKLGGGGSQATAGLQVQNKKVSEIVDELQQAIDDYLLS
ncbi:MAG: DHH family phosphoesterase [Oscillospiraceae bacterium]|nr:DHH family phosphoesterase [Oscillospiraceae bacterium]